MIAAAEDAIDRVLTAQGPDATITEPLSLPEPVERYFRFAGISRYQVAPGIRMEQEGEFLLGGRWRRFTATQFVNPAGPAFVWNAAISLFPGLRVRVEDSYCDGTGGIEARLLGLRVARQQNRTTLAAGELHRYLAEAVWNPPALRPGRGISWSSIDHSSARVSLTAHGITVSLDCLFDGSGRLVSAFTPGRYRDVKGEAVLTPWLCEYRDYVRFNRLMVPQEGEVSWAFPTGLQSYCRLRVTRIERLGHSMR